MPETQLCEAHADFLHRLAPVFARRAKARRSAAYLLYECLEGRTDCPNIHSSIEVVRIEVAKRIRHKPAFCLNEIQSDTHASRSSLEMSRRWGWVPR
jgi:hypothetical protein